MVDGLSTILRIGTISISLPTDSIYFERDPVNGNINNISPPVEGWEKEFPVWMVYVDISEQAPKRVITGSYRVWRREPTPRDWESSHALERLADHRHPRQRRGRQHCMGGHCSRRRVLQRRRRGYLRRRCRAQPSACAGESNSFVLRHAPRGDRRLRWSRAQATSSATIPAPETGSISTLTGLPSFPTCRIRRSPFPETTRSSSSSAPTAGVFRHGYPARSLVAALSRPTQCLRDGSCIPPGTIPVVRRNLRSRCLVSRQRFRSRDSESVD